MQCHRKGRSRSCATRDHGVALITVVIVVAMLAMLTVSALGVMRARTKATAASLELAQAQETLDSAMRLTLIELAAPRDPNSAMLDNGRLTRQPIVFGVAVDVSVELEAQRIDINFADERLLAAVLMFGGRSRADAEAQAQRIVDWRDADDQVTGQGGAERAEYSRAGLPYGPRNAAFESIAELRQVMGLRDLSEAELDAFTVYSHAPMPIESTLQPAVRQALEYAGVGSPKPASVELDVEEEIADAPNEEEEPAQTEGGGFKQPVMGQVIRIRACEANQPRRICRLAVVRFTGNPNNPYLVFDWRSVVR